MRLEPFVLLALLGCTTTTSDSSGVGGLSPTGVTATTATSSAKSGAGSVSSTAAAGGGVVNAEVCDALQLKQECLDKGCYPVDGREFAVTDGVCAGSMVPCDQGVQIQRCVYLPPDEFLLAQSLLFHRTVGTRTEVVVMGGTPSSGGIQGWARGCSAAPDCVEFHGAATQ